MLPMEDKLLDLFARLSHSSARSRVFAMRARKDGRTSLAKLFTALAESQSMQAKRFLMQIRGTVKPTEDNKNAVIDQQLPGIIEEYQELLVEAETLDSKALLTGFRHSGNVNKILRTLFTNLNEEKDDTKYYVCDFCGFVKKDEPPDHCPICTAPKKRFIEIAE